MSASAPATVSEIANRGLLYASEQVRRMFDGNDVLRMDATRMAELLCSAFVIGFAAGQADVMPRGRR